ncbi:MAG: family N-acetyltransferase [Paenibacillaceae bacterium]|nr:family N-acetyltransferase [Paenibacillaceae bacterium]
MFLGKKGLVIPNRMSERQLNEIQELARICNDADHIELKLNKGMLEKRAEGEPNDFLWYKDGKLVGFLALYHFVPKEAEVGGMVHPDYRRQGIFSALTREAVLSAKRQQVPSLLFVCPQQSRGAQAFLKEQHTQYDYSEFGMKLSEQPQATGGPSSIALRKGTESDRQLMIQLDSFGFESPEEDSISIVDMILSNPHEDWPYIACKDAKPVGRINIHIRDGNAHIFGFSVLPEHRRQGYGQQILLEAIGLAANKGLRSVTLEVACGNRKALELYQRCGFRETYVNDYFRLKL